MKHTAHAEWSGGLAFEMEIGAHRFTVDAVKEAGGQDAGPSPKKLLLAGLAGCTGMDVVSLLEKMRVPVDSFSLKIDAQQSDDHPKIYNKITIQYIFTGKELDREKIEKAIRLSQDKYCGVSAMLRKTAEINWEIVLNP